MTIKMTLALRQIRTGFLQAFAANSSAAEKTQLVMQTVRNLCSVYDAAVEVRIIPGSENLAAILEEHRIESAVEVVFVGADPFHNGDYRMIRQALLFGPERALTYRLTRQQKNIIAEAEVNNVGEAILDFLSQACEANIIVPADTLAEINQARDWARDSSVG